MPLTLPTCSTHSVLSPTPCLLHCKQSKQTAIRVEVQHQWRWEQPGLRMLPIRQVNTIHDVAAAAWHEVHCLLAFAQLATYSLSVLQAPCCDCVLETLLCMTLQLGCKSLCHVGFSCIADGTSHDPSSMHDACGCITAFQPCHCARIIWSQQHTHHCFRTLSSRLRILLQHQA